MARLFLFFKFATAALGFLILSGCNESGATSTPKTAQASPPAASANSPPAIIGKPALTAKVDSEYQFTVTASDADGDPLALSATNLPRWLTLDPHSGRLVGTPTSADIGTYSGITIAVTDGAASTKLTPFTIVVGDSWPGNATLSWLPPMENTDGSSVVELKANKIVYGPGPDQLQQSIYIDNPSITRYVIENLSPGTWYFGLVAVNTEGVESAMSGLVSTTIS